MSAGHVGLAAGKRKQTAKAANVGSGDLKLRVKLFQLIFDHTNGEIMTAGAENRVFDIFSGPKQIDLNFFAAVQSLDETWNPQQAIGVNHRRNHPGASCKRDRD
jgi:hypothetical protein